MITITDDARALLWQTIQQYRVNEGDCLRLTCCGSDFKLQVDTPADGDRIIEHIGKPLLLLDPVAEETLGDVVLGVREGPEGKYLAVLEDETEQRAVPAQAIA